MDAQAWDERYAGRELVWSATPNQWVAEICGDLAPGRALDVAAGEGRNAIWLVERGWEVLATDFSEVAVDRMRALADERLDAGRREDLTAAVHDALEPPPGGYDAFDLVLFSYLQLPEPDFAHALRTGVEAAGVGGLVVVIVHALQNLDHGWGGPQGAAVLWDPEDVADIAAGLPVEVVSCELRARVVEDDDGRHEALDTVAVLRRREPA